MKIVITGATGLIGTALSASLRADGNEVVALVRRPVDPRSRQPRWDPAAGTIDLAALEGTDAVVNLAGAGIGDKRWTDDYKQLVLESRTSSTDLISRSIAELDRPPKVLVSGSAIGIYGDTGDAVRHRGRPPRHRLPRPRLRGVGGGHRTRRPTPASGSPTCAPGWCCPATAARWPRCSPSSSSASADAWGPAGSGGAGSASRTRSTRSGG